MAIITSESVFVLQNLYYQYSYVSVEEKHLGKARRNIERLEAQNRGTELDSHTSGFVERRHDARRHQRLVLYVRHNAKDCFAFRRKTGADLSKENMKRNLLFLKLKFLKVFLLELQEKQRL